MSAGQQDEGMYDFQPAPMRPGVLPQDRLIVIVTVFTAVLLEAVWFGPQGIERLPLVFLAIAAIAYRIVLGPNRLIYLSTCLSLISFFFWRHFAALAPPDYVYSVGVGAQVLGYGFALLSLELVQHPNRRTLLVNVSSMVVLLSATFVFQHWEGPAFSSSFTYLVLYYLYIFWLMGKTIELRPWKDSTPRGMRILGLGYIYVLVSLLLVNLGMFLGEDAGIIQFLHSIHISPILINAGLISIIIAAGSRWSTTMPENTIARYGVGQDLTVAFVPLLLGLGGSETMSIASQGMLGLAAFFATALMLWDLEVLQHELNEMTRLVKWVAKTDATTKLPKRLALELLEITQAEAVSIVELTGIDAVNAKHGFANGNRILKEFGKRLKSRVDGRGRVIRSSGTEFMVIWERSIFDIDSRIRSTIAVPFELNNERIYLGIEIGSAVEHNGDLDTLITYAYRNKLAESTAPQW